MYKKHYTVEWTIKIDDRYYHDRKRFESNEGKEMTQFIFDLAHKKGVSKIWKNTFEETIFFEY